MTSEDRMAGDRLDPQHSTDTLHAAVVRARAEKYRLVCLKCLLGFNGELCPRCHPVALPVWLSPVGRILERLRDEGRLTPPLDPIMQEILDAVGAARAVPEPSTAALKAARDTLRTAARWTRPSESVDIDTDAIVRAAYRAQFGAGDGGAPHPEPEIPEHGWVPQGTVQIKVGKQMDWPKEPLADESDA